MQTLHCSFVCIDKNRKHVNVFIRDKITSLIIIPQDDDETFMASIVYEDRKGEAVKGIISMDIK